jgi:hypothetical protein
VSRSRGEVDELSIEEGERNWSRRRDALEQWELGRVGFLGISGNKSGSVIGRIDRIWGKLCWLLE